MAGPMRDVLRDVARVIGGINAREPSAAKPVSRDDILREIQGFMRRLPRAFEVLVPGNHKGGISHNDLIQILAGQGRDFLAVTVQLTQAVSLALRQEFMSGKAIPSISQMQKIAAPALLDHIETRFSKRGNADVSMQPLTAKYRAYKASKGRGGQPIGVATGELRAAFSRNAKVRWL